MPTAASYAPLGGASPQTVESVEELEIDLPVAMECTTLGLVDDAQSESALLIGESQDCGVEPTISHEDTCSATPVAQNLTGLEEQTQPSFSASLLAQNQDCGVEPTISHEDTCSAAPVAQNEFSSSLAIAN